MFDNRTSLLRRLKRERLHVEPRALEMSPPPVRRQFAHAWAPADLLLERLAAWPVGLLAYWLAAQPTAVGRQPTAVGRPAGHVVFTAEPSAYLPGVLPWPSGGLPAVARLSLADLLEGRPALETLAQLVDHLLGSLGDAEGPRLSDGAGTTPALRDVARRFADLAGLGYGPGEPHAYFAWAFAGYWLDRPSLNTADPLAERLLRTTLCSEEFWGRELCTT